MEQPSITAFFAPDAGGPDHPEEAIDDHFELGDLSVTFLIYLYRCAATGTPIYVGQTMQGLDQRDRQHLGAQGAPGSFDDIYTDTNMFTLEILDTATFDADVQTREEYRDLLRRAAAWADRRETEEIDRHGTYDPDGPGLNRTRGGQGDNLRALKEARLLRSCERWANVYRPEFEAYLAEHSSLRTILQAHPTLGRLVSHIRAGRTSVPPEHMEWLHANGFVMNHQRAVWDLDYRQEFEAYLAEHGTLRFIPYAHPTLGNLVNHIRTGHTSVPPEHLEWLLTNGFVMDPRQAVWDLDYRPEFEAYLAEHGTLRAIPRSHPTLGNLVSSIRNGNTSVPPQIMEWLLANGFVMDPRQAVWDMDYRPKFEAYLAEHGTLRNIPQSHPTLGQLVSSIRYGATSVPPEHMEWLLANGFVMNHQQAAWDLDYRPEFEAYLAEHGTLRAIPRSHPTLGRLVNHIRTGHTSVPPEHLEWLRANGFRWSTKNLAAHVTGYLGIPRAELPAEAAESEAVMHCLAETSRLELFGRRSVPELVAMYREQRARL